MKILFDGEVQSPTLILAHGAGAAMDSEFMNVIAQSTAKWGVRIARFEFPYMQQRRETGKKRPPDRAPVLLDCWREVIQQLGGPDQVIIGGKSMGGRMASLIATELPVRGLICLGYPFHPPGKPDKLRIEHFKDIRGPNLFVQGERDPMGKRSEVEGYGLPEQIKLSWMHDGDHDLKPRVKSGKTHQDNLQETITCMADFIAGLGR